MDKIAITRRQKRILTIVGIVGAAFVIFAVFIYIPSQRELARLKREYASAETEVGRIKGTDGSRMSLEEAIISLDARFKTLGIKFPEREEAMLRELSGLLSKLGMEVVSFRPQKKQIIRTVGNSQINIKDRCVFEMPIAITLNTRYKTLGEFFNILEVEFPVFLSAENVQMRTSSQDSPGLLNVDLNMKAYLVCPEAK